MRFAAALMGAAALSGSLLAQVPGPRAGNWQVTMEINIPGMPQGMPPMTMTQCITKEQAADPSKLLPQGAGRGLPPDCKVSDMKTEGNKTSWAMKPVIAPRATRVDRCSPSQIWNPSAQARSRCRMS